MKLKMQDGRVFDGTPAQIVRDMFAMSFLPPEIGTVEKYIDWLGERMKVTIEGRDFDERCFDLLREMEKHGLASPATENTKGEER